jgi:hypothetical protein
MHDVTANVLSTDTDSSAVLPVVVVLQFTTVWFAAGIDDALRKSVEWLNVQSFNGCIESVSINGDSFSIGESTDRSSAFTGCPVDV